MHGGGAAAGDEVALARVDPLLHGDVLDGGDHGVIDRARDDAGSGRKLDAERIGDGADGLLRRRLVEVHPAAEEVVGVDDAEHHVGVGHGRSHAAEAVAGGAGIRARALRPHAKQPARIDMGDGAAAGAHRAHVHLGMPNMSNSVSIASGEMTSWPSRTAETSNEVPPMSTTTRSGASVSRLAATGASVGPDITL